MNSSSSVMGNLMMIGYSASVRDVRMSVSSTVMLRTLIKVYIITALTGGKEEGLHL